VSEWEHVCGVYPSSTTMRMAVPGGWLYRVSEQRKPRANVYEHLTSAMTFVPDPAPRPIAGQWPLTSIDAPAITGHYEDDSEVTP